jgi:hypothetical protein
MRAIAALLFDSDLAEPRGLFPPEDVPAGGGLDAQAREWCQTPPGPAALKWLGAKRRPLRKAVIGAGRESA